MLAGRLGQMPRFLCGDGGETTAAHRTRWAASALNEIAAAGVGMRVQERTVPIREVVHGACEILGLDPLYVANEGRFAIVPLEHADAALDVLLRLPASQQAARIGIITEKPGGTVALESRIGGCADLIAGLWSGRSG